MPTMSDADDRNIPIEHKLNLPAFTQRGMRRTYNDLARFAKVDRLVKKSVSGHGTDEMEELYSSVAPEEQRDGIAKVIRLVRQRWCAK